MPYCVPYTFKHYSYDTPNQEICKEKTTTKSQTILVKGWTSFKLWKERTIKNTTKKTPERLVLLRHSIYRDLQLPHWINRERNLPQYVYCLRVLQVWVLQVLMTSTINTGWMHPSLPLKALQISSNLNSKILRMILKRHILSDWNFSNCIYYFNFYFLSP